MAHGSAQKERVRLRPADSFDLIRLIARSQNDPRKAIAELVQNSLDAQATHIAITWWTHRGERAITISDDGQGIFPELDRREALKRIATTIGQSHKRRLSLAERQELMTLGKYGIGLLGFWSVGRLMEIRSRSKGADAFLLRLREEGREAEVVPLRTRPLFEATTLNEVSILALHKAALGQLKPRRLASYLASELRGQLLAREVELVIHDRVARGLAPKKVVVRPLRYRGVAVSDQATLKVPGHPDARYEIYLIPAEEERLGQVALECGGSLVADDLAALENYGLNREPWSSHRFEGFIDFPALEVAPGTRRGFAPNAAAQAFLEALAPLEARLLELLARDRERQQETREENVVRELRRVFRALPRSLPHYQWFEVAAAQLPAAGAAASQGSDDLRPQAADDAAASDPGDVTVADGLPAHEPQLFAPGPLAALKILPARCRVPEGGARSLRVVALDRDDRPAADPFRGEWRLDHAELGTLVPSADDPARATFRAGDRAGKVTITAAAHIDAATEVSATAVIDIVETPDPLDARGGIPRPEPLHRPAEDWRSRLRGLTWEYNIAHRDYVAVRDDPRRRLQYLVHLFAKELVLRNFGSPADGALLEKMIEVLTHIDPPRTRSK